MNHAVFPLSALAAAVSAFACAATVEVHEACLGMGSVTWSQSVQTNGTATLTLSATAAAGYSFSGWLVDGAAPKWDADARNPSLTGVSVATNAAVTATFLTPEEDTLSFDLSGDLSEFKCGVAVDVPLVVLSESYPTLTVSGLPAGLSFDARTLSVRGTPTTPCVKTVVVKGVNASGYSFSETFVSSVTDLSSARLSAEETELPMGEYYSASFDEIFKCDGERASTTLTGLPQGLEWRESWDLVFGTPTKSGTYVVKATARFTDGKSETATARLTIVPPDPSDYDVDLSVLESLSVGDVLESHDCEIGRNVGGLGVVSVEGLPTGLSVETWLEDGEKVYGVVGLARQAGLFTVRVGVKVQADEKTSTVVVEAVSDVSDTPGRFLRVSVDATSPEGSGTVSGGGVLPAATGTTIKASPAPGFVFAGWLDAECGVADLGDGVDYRNPSIEFGAEVKFEYMELNGLFVSAEDDYMVWFEDLQDETFSFSADDSLEEYFYVRSQSLPVLTAKGLPTGVSIVPDVFGRHRIVYDGETAAKRPRPGRYVATVTAVNRSGVSASASFLLVVENETDERIHVEDDYGELVPGEAIEPIDLSKAVDFDSGETLSVSGLPRGLAWNAKANAKSGIAAYTITGVPTQPGEYTLTFTAKVVASATTNAQGRVQRTYTTATATAFLTVMQYPELSIEVDEECLAAGCKVSGQGNYREGTKVSLKATPAKGWVFAGWEGIDDYSPFATLSPTYALTSGHEDSAVVARFVQVKDDWLDVIEPNETEAGFAAEFLLGEEVGETKYAYLVADIVETVSLPTISLAGLPAGVKYNAKTFALSGKPTKPGVYYVTVTAKNAGGYTFVRVLRIAVLDAEGGLPEEAALPNAANIDFSPLDKLTTGSLCREGDVSIVAEARQTDEAEVRKVAVSGVPAGLKATASVENGVGKVEFEGTPSKPGRTIMSVTVTYSDGKTAKSQYAVNVLDGGSYYLSVESVDGSMGTASGSGVYSSGATVKIAAKAAKKCVFSGWLDGVDGDPFEPMAETDGIDFRTATASFPFRPDDFSGDCAVYADFVSSEDDVLPFELAFEGLGWDIDTETPSRFGFSVDSLSLPKLTVKNLPKGVTVDLARGWFEYVPNASTQSGIYLVSVTAQNQSKAKATATFEIYVANRETDMISGLDSSMDGYSLSVGVALDPSRIVPVVADGVSLSVKGLPAGLSFKNGVVSGIPTKAGDYTVTFTAVEGTGKAKKTGVATITLRVAALPSGLVGTFNGFIYDDSVDSERAVGTFTATASAVGKISVSVKTLSGTESFSASGWSQFDEMGFATCEMSARNGSSLSVSVESEAGWNSWQLAGTYKRADGELRIEAQRNAFDAKTGEADARAIAESLVGTYKNGALTASVQKTGAVRISGKYEGLSISGSTVLFVDHDGVFVKYPHFDKKAGIIEINIVFDEKWGSAQWSVLDD